MNIACARLLAGNARRGSARFAGGTFATIYLAPYNYHRIHMRFAGELRESVLLCPAVSSV
jgi:phosphatidylserine decarboxylase